MEEPFILGMTLDNKKKKAVRLKVKTVFSFAKKDNWKEIRLNHLFVDKT